MQNEKTLKILMLEDNQDDIGLIERILHRDNLSFVSQCVDTRDEFTEAMAKFRPDVVLSDHGLPQFNSREALKICLKERAFIPFILVTGTMSDEFAISCLREGADDYILKSNLSRLPLAIRRAVKERRLESLKREARRALRKQNEELLKVNKELDNFVYSVSHNLRGPLASVMGLLNLAKIEDADQKLASLHTMMGTSIGRLDDTLEEIVSYSKNVRSDVIIQEINFEKLIDECFAKLQYIDATSKISKTTTVERDAPFYCDENRLSVIFNNIFSNSILYRDDAKATRISTRIAVTAEAATITIEDNGIGIKEDIMPKIYNMFYRGTQESQGAGLGLYIVKEIVGRLKGKITITSEPGMRTTCTLILPNLKNQDTPETGDL